MTAHLLYTPARIPVSTTGLPTVLLAEDRRREREHIVSELRVLGIEPFVATRGYQAIELAYHHHPELVLLDGLLPEMHGLEVARVMRHLDAGYRPHIALLTAVYKSTRYRNEAKLKYGIDTYLVKPLEPGALEELVRNVEVPR